MYKQSYLNTNSKDKLDENINLIKEEQVMNNNFLWNDFISIYWKYKYVYIDPRFIDLFLKIALNNNYIKELNKKASIGVSPAICILENYKEDLNRIYINNSKYFINPLIGAVAGYFVKYHPESLHMQNDKKITVNLNNENYPKSVTIFKR